MQDVRTVTVTKDAALAEEGSARLRRHPYWGRRRALSMALALPPALVVAACGVASQPAAPDLSQRKVKIAVAYHTTGAVEQNQGAAQLVQGFRDKHPNIEIDEVTAGGPAINEKILALLAAGSPPDVMRLGYPGAGGADDLAARGALLTLDDRIKRDKAFNWDDFWPGAKLVGQFEGAQMALPYGGVNGTIERSREPQ